MKPRRERIPRIQAWVDIPVSEQVLVEGGAAFRAVIRDMANRAIEEVAREAGEEWRYGKLRYFVDPFERYGLLDAMPADRPWTHVIRAVLLR